MSYELPRSSAPEHADQRKNLEKNFIAGKVTKEEFLNALRDFDQSTPERFDAAANVELLTRPEIRSLFETDAEYRSQYYGFLSFSYFHVAQLKAAQGDNEVLTELQQALEAAMEDRQEFARDWESYVRGNTAYFQKDRETLASAIGDTEDERNREILELLLGHMDTGATPNYREALE